MFHPLERYQNFLSFKGVLWIYLGSRGSSFKHFCAAEAYQQKQGFVIFTGENKKNKQIIFQSFQVGKWLSEKLQNSQVFILMYTTLIGSQCIICGNKRKNRSLKKGQLFKKKYHNNWHIWKIRKEYVTIIKTFKRVYISIESITDAVT